MNVRKKNPAGIVLTVMLLAALLTICLELGLSYLRPDTPGSIPKHLIHFAIMFALLGGAILLCLFCPPFKKLWAWIDEHILTQETRPVAIDIIYAVIAGLMLLHHFYVLLYYPTIPAGATKFAPIWIVFAAVTIFFNKSWRSNCFRIAAIFLIYTFERLFIKNLSLTGNDTVYYSSSIYALFICLGAFLSLRVSVRKFFLQALCTVWTLATLALSLLGLYTAWTGIRLLNLVNAEVYVWIGRLHIFSSPTITAGILGCGVIMGLIGFSITKNKFCKTLFLIISIVITATNSLTDSRSSIFMLSCMVAGMISLSLWNFIQNREVNRTHQQCKTILAILSILLCFVLCFFLSVESQRAMGHKIIDIRNNRGIIPVAIAEESIPNSTPAPTATPKPPQFNHREVWLSANEESEDGLDGRISLWRLAPNYIQKNPQTLLYGVTIDGSVAPIVGREDHSHNILLQTLLEGGIPSLLLYLSLVFYGVFHAFRLWNRRDVPFWQQVLPLPVFSILLWEMAECLTHFSFGHPPMTLFWFFLGATITVSKSLGKTPKANEIPTTIPDTETGE